MTKQEFENLALRDNATISCLLYDMVEYFYMSENNYHRYHGGINETKQEFVKRVFGGKVNTPKTILEKTIKEAQAENRYALIGCPSATENELNRMDMLIAEHLSYCARFDY